MRRGALLAVVLAALALPPIARAGGDINVTGFVGERTGAFPGAGQALSGASVQLFSNDVVVDSDTTDVGGNYTVTAPVGPLEVVASKTGYETQCRKFSANGSPVTPPPIEMPLTSQGGGLSGTVTDSFTDQPISGVTVEVSYDQGCDTVATTQTNNNGLYLFPSVPGPEQLLTFSLAGYNSRTDEVTVYSGATAHNTELEPVDSFDPRTKIKSVTVDGHKATVKFKIADPPPSSGGLNATCQLDDEDIETLCESPKKYTHLSKGRHKVKIVGFDANGNFDETPAKETFSIH